VKDSSASDLLASAGTISTAIWPSESQEWSSSPYASCVEKNLNMSLSESGTIPVLAEKPSVAHDIATVCASQSVNAQRL